MRTRLLIAVFGLLAGLATAQTPPPIEAYGQLPVVRAMTLSPSGNKLAYIMDDGEMEGLVVYDLTTNEQTGVNTTRIKARGVHFANERFVILSASDTRRLIGYRGRLEYSGAFSFDTESNDVEQLLVRADGVYPGQSGIGRVVGRLSGEDRLLMPAYSGGHGAQSPPYSLFKARLDSGRGRLIERGRNHTIDWFVNDDGTVLAREDHNNKDDVYSILTKRSGKWQPVYQLEDAELRPFHLAGVKADESALIVIDDTADGKSEAIFELAFDGSWSGPFFLEDGKEIDYVVTDYNRRVFGVAYSGMQPSYAFYDEALTEKFEALQEQYPLFSFHIASWSDDWSRVLLQISGGREAGNYYVFEPETMGLGFVASSREIERDAVAPVDTIEYPARDGLRIPGLLTWPIGDGRRENLPLIVMPHGGPASYDQLSFDWMAQFFASRGYLVLQPNFRGSSGFGYQFESAGHGEWGGKMQDDVTDGVMALINGGMADPERVCIVGGSYGGYAALAGGAFTPDLYKCVAAIAPVSDLPRMLIDERRDHGQNHGVYAYWQMAIGDAREHREKLERISPVNHAAAFQAPVLLIHGKDDLIVPIRQSKRMRSALRAADKPVELIELKGEDHWLSTRETRLETLRALDAFVTEHIGAP